MRRHPQTFTKHDQCGQTFLIKLSKLFKETELKTLILNKIGHITE